MDNSVKNDEIVDNFNANYINNNVVLESEQNINKNNEKKRTNRYLGNLNTNYFIEIICDSTLEIAFMACVSGGGLLFGFSTALATAKKKDSNAFDKVWPKN